MPAQTTDALSPALHTAPPKGRETTSEAPLAGASLLLLCFFLSGAAGLIYQVAWTKSLGLLFGYSAYAIAAVVAVFMGGLALGSVWLGKWCEKRNEAVAIYGWVGLGGRFPGGAL